MYVTRLRFGSRTVSLRKYYKIHLVNWKKINKRFQKLNSSIIHYSLWSILFPKIRISNPIKQNAIFARCLLNSRCFRNPVSVRDIDKYESECWNLKIHRVWARERDREKQKTSHHPATYSPRPSLFPPFTALTLIFPFLFPSSGFARFSFRSFGAARACLSSSCHIRAPRIFVT